MCQVRRVTRLKMKEEIILPSLYILGTQRSGTTLLTRILSSHPNYYAQNEEMHIKRIFSSIKSIDDVKKNFNNEFLRKVSGDPINDFLKKNGLKAWAYKDPQLTEYMDCLELIIKESKTAPKFILIVRDARGVVNSYIDNKWGLGTNAYTGALRWRREVREQLNFMEKYQDLFLLIRFEDLLQNMEESIRAICKHVDLEYVASMLQYYQKKANYKEKRENINTYKKPDNAIAQKWRQSLSQKEIDIIEHVAKDELLHLGYKISNNHIEISKLKKLYYMTHQKVIGEIQLGYRWRKAYILDFIDCFRKRKR